MKQLKNIAMLCIALHLFSCEDTFLSPAPISSIGGDAFFRDDEELEQGLINMYDGIQGVNSTSVNDNHGIQLEYQLTEMRSDNTMTKSSEGEPAQFERFDVQVTNGSVSDYYRSFYNVIFRANVVLDNIGAASEGRVAAIEGEARFVRAYAYFNLVRLFGDIPLIKSVIKPGDEEVAYTRVATNEIYERIVSDLNAAVTGLDNTYKTRASKAAAQSLLAKAHLTLGNYAEARPLLEDVIESEEFSLEENFRDIFYNEGNDEVIFAIGYAGDVTNDSQNFSAEWLNAVGRSSGLNYVTDDARTAFAAFGGTQRPGYSFRQDAAQNQFYQVVKYLPNGDATLGIDPTSADPTLAGNDWIVIRYADVLLMHVEAILAGGNLTADSDALASFQLVRDRDGLTTPVTSITRQELLDERRVELAFENHRLFDLIRFGEAENVLGAFAAANGYSFSANDLLLPIPQREINLSGETMRQNPGYN